MMVEPKREILLVPLLRIGLLRAWAARNEFIRLAIVPVVVLLLIAAPLQEALIGARAGLNAPAATPPDLGAMMQGMLLALLEGAVIALFALNWIRQLTLGRSAVPGLGLAITARHFRFLSVMLAITVAVMLPSTVGAAIALVTLPNSAVGVLAIFVMGMLLWIALISRLSPAWIGIAIDARMPLSIAWSRTAGQGFKLVLAVLAVEVMTMIVQQFVSAILAVVGFITIAPYSFMLVVVTIGLAGLAAQISVLVTAFPHFLRETV
jgi:hypothetical protein